MAAVVDIVNAALGHLGDEATVSSIDPPDGSAQAGHAARFYPMARDALLEMHTWRFNTVRAVLAPSAVPASVGWAFAYVLPNLAIKPIAVLMPTALPPYAGPVSFAPNDLDTQQQFPFVVESSPIDGTANIYTSVDQAMLVYSVIITDTTKFTPLFTAALARLLASYLAGPLIKGKTGADVAKEQLGIFTKMDFPKAVESDANSQLTSPYTSAMPAPIAARM